MDKGSDRYREAGVDLDAASDVVRRILPLVKSTFGPQVKTELGGFGGAFAIDETGDQLLVAATDGVGTKLKIAFALDRHDTVGVDLVAMSVNDILTCGARPLFFLDYIAVGKLVPDRVADVIAGIASGCRQARCALLGGETAEMPGFYSTDEYDLAGFAVGMVTRRRMEGLTGARPGDALLGLHSAGLHSNGYSLVRRVLIDEGRHDLGQPLPGLDRPLGEELLEPTRIYVPYVLPLLDRFDVRGMAHITGGGLPENLPRCLPDGLGAQIDRGSWPIPVIFELLSREGSIAESEMYNVFNMGIGYVLVVPQKEARDARSAVAELGWGASIIGRVAEQPGVTFEEAR